MTNWSLGDLATSHPCDGGRPAQTAYSAMTALIAQAFLRSTRLERARQVHRGTTCRPICELCWDITLKHSQWATDKLHAHIKKGPPLTRNELVRDWVTILSWVTSPDRNTLPIDDVRTGLDHRLVAGDPRLPLVLALRTQLLPTPGDARGPRKAREAVGDARRSVVALQQQWAVKPDRDLKLGKRFAPLWAAHPRGCELLIAVFKELDRGEVEPYQQVLTRLETQPGDRDALRAVIATMLDDPDLHDWFMREVDARQTYNQYQAARTLRSPDVEALVEGAW